MNLKRTGLFYLSIKGIIYHGGEVKAAGARSGLHHIQNFKQSTINKCMLLLDSFSPFIQCRICDVTYSEQLF